MRRIDTTELEQSHAWFMAFHKRSQVQALLFACLQYFAAGWNMRNYMAEHSGLAWLNLLAMTGSTVMFARLLLHWDWCRQSAQWQAREVAELLRMAKEANEEPGA